MEISHSLKQGVLLAVVSVMLSGCIELDINTCVNSTACSSGEGSSDSSDPTPNQKIIFVSSVIHNGDFLNYTGGPHTTGLDGADLFCQDLADAVPLQGTFKAIMSDSTTNAIDRLSSLDASVSIELLDGTNIAMGSADLWDNNINDRIDITELNGVPPGSQVWTGTNPSGVATINVCSDWSYSGASYGDTGSVPTNGFPTWVESSYSYCFSSLPVYCLEQ